MSPLEIKVVPDELVSELQEIFRSESDLDKAALAREAIARVMCGIVPANGSVSAEGSLQPGMEMMLVRRGDAQAWLQQIREDKAFREQVAEDLGRVIENFHSVISGGNFVKIAGRLLMGKADAKSIGLDSDFITAVGKKYAPAAMERIKAKEKQNTKK